MRAHRVYKQASAIEEEPRHPELPGDEPGPRVAGVGDHASRGRRLGEEVLLEGVAEEGGGGEEEFNMVRFPPISSSSSSAPMSSTAIVYLCHLQPHLLQLV